MPCNRIAYNANHYTEMRDRAMQTMHHNTLTLKNKTA